MQHLVMSLIPIYTTRNLHQHMINTILTNILEFNLVPNGVSLQHLCMSEYIVKVEYTQQNSVIHNILCRHVNT